MTDPTRVVTIDFESGGSGRGVSWHMDAAGCPLRRALRDLAGKRAEANGLPREHNWAAWEHADRGTVFHALVAAYHTGWINPEQALEIPCPEAKSAFDEGVRFFTGYKEHFPPNFWGEVIGTEVKLFTGEQEDELPPFVVPVTIDMIIQVDEEDISRIVRHLPTLQGMEPGVYLVDWKTRDQKPYNLLNAYGGKVQGLAYQAAYNYNQFIGCPEDPEEPCKGMIYMGIVGHKPMRLHDEGPRKPKSFWPLLQRTPSQADLEMLGSFLLSARALSETRFPNLSSCEDFGSCSYYVDGERTCLELAKALG